MEMDAYLDDFKTSICPGYQRGSGEASRDHRGPSSIPGNGPGNPPDFMRFS